MNAVVPFADRLQRQIDTHHSVLVAGIDPRLEDLPGFVLAEASQKTTSLPQRVEYALKTYLDVVLAAIAGQVAAVKPNLGFFEQYGLPGMSAFSHLMLQAREAQILTIADGKRGDIGSTAQAYSAAFLGRSSWFGEKVAVFDADALTVNPFLGFDTLEEFLKDCVRYGKGLFVLVKTSNPGSAALQGAVTSGDHSVSSAVASWCAEHGASLRGQSGLSGLGAVVGATYPEEAIKLRQVMPHGFFLIPGLGAQGGSARDAAAGFAAGSPRRGGIVNVSRGLFSFSNAATLEKQQFLSELHTRLQRFNSELAQALA